MWLINDILLDKRHFKEISLEQTYTHVCACCGLFNIGKQKFAVFSYILCRSYAVVIEW